MCGIIIDTAAFFFFIEKPVFFATSGFRSNGDRGEGKDPSGENGAYQKGGKCVPWDLEQFNTALSERLLAPLPFFCYYELCL